jgi:uncharacterized protein DUF5818
VIRKHVPRLTVGILVGVLLMATVVLAQLPRAEPGRPQTRQTQTPAQANSDEDLRFFTGKISNNNGKYVLEGESPGGPYLLDDQKTAKRYEGKHVRVIGALDQSTNTIHVQKIQEAAPA